MSAPAAGKPPLGEGARRGAQEIAAPGARPASGSEAEAPVLIAYDGSAVSRSALRHAAAMFPGRQVVVATVWEPGLAQMNVGSYGDAYPAMKLPPPIETVNAVDRAQREHATSVARDGAELCRTLGLPAQPRAVEDEVDVADTLIQLADSAGAVAIVVGTHGITGLRSHLTGSVTRKLLSHCRRPVVVVSEETGTES